MKKASSHSRHSSQNYVKQTSLVCLIIVFIIISHGSLKAQKISYELCKRVEKDIINPMNPVKIYHSYILSDSCSFEFETKTDRLMIDLDLYETDLKASSDLKGYLESFLEFNDFNGKPKFSVVDSDFTESWSEAFFYRSNVRDNFLLLRRHNLNISIISTDEQAIRQIESAFEKINFEIYEKE